MDEPDKTVARNAAIGAGVLIALLAVMPCLLAALIAFGVAAYYSLSAPPPVAPAPPLHVEQAPPPAEP